MAGIYQIYFRGLRTSLHNHPIIGIVYLFNFVISALIVWPVITAFNDIIGGSGAGERLLEQSDMSLLLQIVDQLGDRVSLLPLFISYLLIYCTVSFFMNGGVLFSYSGRNSFTAARFIRGGIDYYLRFLRLFLLSLAIIAVIFIFYSLFSALIIFSFGLAFIPIMFIILILWMGILLVLFDCTRIRVVLYNERKIIRAFLTILSLRFKHMLAILYLSLLYAFPAFLLIGIHLLFADLYIMGALIAFIYSQVVIVIKTYLRLSQLAGQMVYLEQTYKTE